MKYLEAKRLAEKAAEQKAAEVPPENKAMLGAPENKDTQDLSALTLAELKALAEERGVTVERADGKPGAPTKADYVRALS